MAEATDAAGRHRQADRRGEGGRFDPVNHQLGDAVAPLDLVGRERVQVDEQDPELVAIPGVDETGAVEHGDAVAQRQAAAGLHEPGVSLGNGDGDAGGDEGPAAGRRQHNAAAGDEIGPGVARPGVGGQCQVGIEGEDGDLNHALNATVER